MTRLTPAERLAEMRVVRVPGGVRIDLPADEAGAVCDDLGGIGASEISAAGDELHGLLLELVADEEVRGEVV